ncbi:MAG: DUF1559 domain-containing protein [Planctomycetia bacterium]|nr:DUF1559 domain-containing protein [Planctomycetia bacterium]
MRTCRMPLAVAATAAILIAMPTAAEEKLGPPTREQYKAAAESLKQIGLAFHNFESANRHFPGNIEDKDGKPMLSWRVAILPYIEQEALYKQFKLDEPWDSDNNKKLIEKMPKLYAPVRIKAKKGETFYQMFSGAGTLLEPKEKIGILSITDGTSNTGLVFEAGDPVIWSKPQDMPFNEKKQLPRIGAPLDGECTVVLCDGSVKVLKKDADEGELKKFITRADGQVIDLDKITK